MTGPVVNRHPLPLHVEGPDGRRLVLSRAWPRSATHALIEMTSSNGDTVAGQWLANDGDRWRLHRALPGAFVCGPVVLQPAGLDVRLPALAPLLRQADNTLLVHRPGRRAVIRRSRIATTYLKLVRPGRVAAIAAATGLLPACTGIGPHIVRFAALIDVDEDLGVIELAEIRGRSLHELPVDRTWAPTWAAAGRAVSALHDSEPVVAQHLARDEARTTRRWLDLAVAYGLLDIDTDTAATIAAVLHELETGPPGPQGVLHRDLHDKQILVSDDGPPGLIDLDTLAVGERALDLANLLAHLELRLLQGHRTQADVTVASNAFIAGADAHFGTLSRIPVHLAATRLRLAAVYAFRPRWQHLASQLLTRTTMATGRTPDEPPFDDQLTIAPGR